MILKDVELVTVDGENYLTSNETNNKLFIFCINNELTVACFDELLGDGIQWVKNIAVEPEQIGMVYEESKLNEYHKIVPINANHIEAIIANGGHCKIEVNNILPTVHEDTEPTQKLFEPILIDNKVIIHL
jgi:hypothetical protein